MKKKRFPYWVTIILLLLVGVASWSMYNLLSTAFEDLLSKIGVDNAYIQGLTIVGFVISLLVVLGFSARKSLEKLVK